MHMDTDTYTHAHTHALKALIHASFQLHVCVCFILMTPPNLHHRSSSQRFCKAAAEYKYLRDGLSLAANRVDVTALFYVI